MQNLLHRRLQAVVRLHFHATGDKPLSELQWEQYQDTLVSLLEDANDQKHTLREESEE